MSICKETLHAYTAHIRTEHLIPMHMMSSFSQIRIFSLHGDDNGIVFKNFNTETSFKSLRFQATTMLSCK